MPVLRTRMHTFGLVALVACGLVACSDDDGTGLDPIERADLVASYEATTLTTTIAGVTTDALADGTTVTVVLNADGTTTGRFVSPGELDETLDGTWTFDEATSQVTFGMTADTFLRDVPFEAVRVGGVVALQAEPTFGEITIDVVLAQS